MRDHQTVLCDQESVAVTRQFHRYHFLHNARQLNIASRDRDDIAAIAPGLGKGDDRQLGDASMYGGEAIASCEALAATYHGRTVGS